MEGAVKVWRAWYAGRLGLEEMERLGWGRMVGDPRQHYLPINKIGELGSWIERVHASGVSPYISISYYEGHGLLAGVERLMLDLDAMGGMTLEDVLGEARRLVDHLRSYCEPLILYTGGRGIHIHAWLPTVIDVREMDSETAGDLYRILVEVLGLGGLGLRSLDPAVVRPTVLSRPPYTLHESRQKVQPLDTDFRPIELESFSLKPHFSSPLPRSLVGEAVSKALRRQAARRARAFLHRGRMHKAPRSYGWIEKVLRRGLPDGRRRFMLYIASKYLVNTLRLGEDEAVEILMDFAERSEKRPDFRGSGKIYRAEAKSFVRSARSYGKDPPGLRTVAEKDPELYKLITQVLGQRPSSTPRGTSSEPNIDLSRLGIVGGFVEETGLAEFGYDDFKRWLEAKRGPLSAEEWSGYARMLRRLAQEGLLGRKFLVNGRWIDVGPGKVEEPPSRSVRFYMVI